MPKGLRRTLQSTTSRSALHRHWTAQNRKAWDAMAAPYGRGADGMPLDPPTTADSTTPSKRSGRPAEQAS
jgi:hypothetical protein